MDDKYDLIRTTRLVRNHIPTNIANIVIEYFRAKTRSAMEIAQCGEYETCINLCKDYTDRMDMLEGVCSGNHMELLLLVCPINLGEWNHVLSCACIESNVEFVKLALSRGAKFDDSNVYYPCLNGCVEIVDLLVSNNITNWRNGLYGACRGNQIELVKLMISKTNVADFNLALYYACRFSNREILNLILSCNPTNFNHGLSGACARQDKELQRMMIARGGQLCWTCRKSVISHQ